MAPTKLASKTLSTNENTNGFLTKGITTRSKIASSIKMKEKDIANKMPGKRKALSPLKDNTAKRAAFGDITNALKKPLVNGDKEKVKKVTIEAKVLPTVKSVKQSTVVTNGLQINGKSTKTRQVQKIAAITNENAKKAAAKEFQKAFTRTQSGILKNGCEKFDTCNKENSAGRNTSKRSDNSESSLYVSALEYISPQDTRELCNKISEKLDAVALDDKQETPTRKSYVPETDSPHKVPEGVSDFDKDNWDDPCQVSHYAMDIFNYLKNRENLFVIDNYMERQKEITSWMRTLLIDWMVEVQESFELNHETLYLAVKLVDLFLCKENKANKDQLQLVGAAALFIASKFDERVPPLIDDFLYICDGAYSLRDLLRMEINILKTIDFDLGIPLSYRFLRRYARCARVSMPTLTLARFILELCLLEYGLVGASDSKMAAAALLLARRMKDLGSWNETLVYYTGFQLKEILPIAKAQNAILHKKPKDAIRTVRNKYSHKIFFEVAKVPLIDDKKIIS